MRAKIIDLRHGLPGLTRLYTLVYIIQSQDITNRTPYGEGKDMLYSFFLYTL